MKDLCQYGNRRDNEWELLPWIPLEDVEEIFEDPSEQEVLWHIQTQLEKELVEPFQADYQAIIEEARRAVTEQY